MPTAAANLIAAVEQAGLTSTARSQRRVHPRLRALHRAVLGAFLDTGSAPSLGWLRERAATLDLEPDEAIAELARADLVLVDQQGVTVAYPFSAGPSRDRVQLDGGPSLWAMCAIDALGVLLMTGGDGVISTIDPESGEPIQVRRRGARWEWSPDTTVVAAGLAISGATAADACCPHVSFHATAHGADASLRAHPELTGPVLDHDAALAVAGLAFGPLLHDPEAERST